MFRIVQCALDDKEEVVTRRALQPLFALWEDASAMAEFDSSRLGGDNRYDGERNCWCAKDSRGRMYRFEIEAVTATDVAA
jgi:hypothetical protein